MKNIYFEEMIKKLLGLDPVLELGRTNVITKNGEVVILEGEVSTYTEKCLIERRIKHIKGVKSVVNDLKVNLISKCIISDDEIEKNAVKLINCSNFNLENKSNIIVDVIEGCLNLSGQVNYFFEKDLAQKLVENIQGIVDINSEISVRHLIDPQVVKDLIIEELIALTLAEISNIEVEILDREIILKGHVRSINEKNIVENLALSIPDVLKVKNLLVIT